MATSKGIVKSISDLSVGFHVGPFQTSIPFASASNIIVLAAGKYGWWTKDRANCLQWLTQLEGSLLVAAGTFDNAGYSALEGFTPLPAHSYPTKIFSIFQSLWKILKTFQIIENTRNIASIVLILRICGVKVSKIQVEREGGVGG
jgi:hypothetical protein